MQHLIKADNFFQRLEKSIEGQKYTLHSPIKIRHIYECMKLSFTLEEYGNVCIDILPRVEKTDFGFLVVINVESDEGGTKEYLEKQLGGLLRELREQAVRLVKGTVSPKTKVMFFLLGGTAHLYIRD